MKTTKTFDITEKARVYHTTAQLTSSFSSIIRYCEELEQAGVLTPKYRHLFQAFTMEVQSDINLHVLEHMDSVESEDWHRSGQVRSKWEKYLRFESNSQPKPPGKAAEKERPKAQKPSPQKRAGSGA
jgi:hypothetical protein